MDTMAIAGIILLPILLLLSFISSYFVFEKEEKRMECLKRYNMCNLNTKTKKQVLATFDILLKKFNYSIDRLYLVDFNELEINYKYENTFYIYDIANENLKKLRRTNSKWKNLIS